MYHVYDHGSSWGCNLLENNLGFKKLFLYLFDLYLSNTLMIIRLELPMITSQKKNNTAKLELSTFRSRLKKLETFTWANLFCKPLSRNVKKWRNTAGKIMPSLFFNRSSLRGSEWVVDFFNFQSVNIPVPNECITLAFLIVLFC